MTAPYLTTTNEDVCPNCGQHVHEHDKERVTDEEGRTHWPRYCPDGTRLPVNRDRRSGEEGAA